MSNYNKFELYEHQKLMLSYLRTHESFAIFAEQGTGKTLPMLIHLLELFQSGKIGNALIVCPKPVINSWYRDMGKFERKDQILFKDFVIVTNYEQLISKKNKQTYFRRWDCIVLDESHYIKERTTARAKASLELSLYAKYRYILTGTPINNGRLENIWAQLAFLNPKQYRGHIMSEILGSYSAFQNQYCFLDQWFKPYKYKNVDDLQKTINSVSYRVTKKEALDLPEKLPDQIYEIEMVEKQMYSQLHKTSVVEEFELLAENGLSRLSKLRQLSSGFLFTDLGLKSLRTKKLGVLSDYLDSFEKKLVIFCEFKHSMENVASLLRDKDIKYVFLNGEQKDKAIWKQFQQDDSIRVIVCQYQSAATGIDLFAADTIIYYEPTLSSNLLEQSRDRIHRIGQTQKCSYIFFITKGTIEEKIYKALSNYSDFNKKLFEEYMKEYTKTYNTKRGIK